LLKDNDLGVVDNPLLYRDRADLIQDARRFHHDQGLANNVSAKTFTYGVLLAQDEDCIFDVEQDHNEQDQNRRDAQDQNEEDQNEEDQNEQDQNRRNALDQEEQAALKQEKAPKLKEQSDELNLILLTCCVAAIVQGWSQASITGANLQWPCDLIPGLVRTPIDGQPESTVDSHRLDTYTCDWTSRRTIFSAVCAVTYLSASLIGTVIVDPLNEYVAGRRGALFASGILTLAASVASGYARSWQELFVCRLFLGIGYGAKGTVCLLA